MCWSILYVLLSVSACTYLRLLSLVTMPASRTDASSLRHKIFMSVLQTLLNICIYITYIVIYIFKLTLVTQIFYLRLFSVKFGEILFIVQNIRLLENSFLIKFATIEKYYLFSNFIVLYSFLQWWDTCHPSNMCTCTYNT